MNSPFTGRSLAIAGDLSVDEQLYLYKKTKELKSALLSGGDVSRFRLRDTEICTYLIFLEDSTRTKESFRNAAMFHGTKVNVFDAGSSSFNKSESMTDTVKMLTGYTIGRSNFIIRSGLEGVCRWLSEAIGEYAKKIGRPAPVFINAGDGKHEHPTQEFLDEFSFLERKNWETDSIHIALVGDLAHGRTIHSKADGLRVFKEVSVDLIAPKEMAMPQYYLEKMAANGFKVRSFNSIEEYLSQSDKALIWYFTRLQLERMGDDVRDKVASLRKSVTFTEEYLERVSPDTRFYHPLPRHRVYPTIPQFLDELPFNAWDEQSINGYYTRIMEIALFNGLFGDDFSGASQAQPSYADDFVKEVRVKETKAHDYKVGIKPVDNGIVIDHIGKGQPIEDIWKHIDKIRRIMKLNFRSSHGVYHSNSEGKYKGIISLPDILSFDEGQIKMLGAVAPGCTLNIIKDRNVLKKYRLLMPPRVYRFDEISCKNENCISHPKHAEHVTPEFFRSEKSTFVCKYCEKPHTFHEIWDD